ncbi:MULTISPECIES: AMP-binding protein [Actinomyces]|uniref:AMP-binding protein n=1 Tax=Actinomyces respiraculi TaxID=2744574 RepID=A0A7T0LM20_9ACTO|nr:MULTISPECIES: AMP-binding protein [Actinomyces]QPL06256.1 AMP-binding protein [Actinomyces respiraculi]
MSAQPGPDAVPAEPTEPAGRPGSEDSALFHRPHYQPGIPATVEVPDGPLGELLEQATRFYPERVAIDFMGWTTTYSELLAASERAATLLLEVGVRKGDRVALIMPNCPQHVVAVYGALRIGAVVAEHNPLAPAEQLRAQIAHHGARVAVVWEKGVEHVADLEGLTVLSVDLSQALPAHLRAALRLPLARTRTVRASMKAERLPAGVRSWDREVARATPIPASWPQPTGADLAVLLHTGGTTGTPKAAMLTHRNLRANTNQSTAWVPMLHEGGENFLSLLPFFHAFGLTFNLFCAVQKAATQVMMPTFDPAQTLRAHRRRRLTFFVGVPVMFERILRAAQQAGADLTSLRYGVCGAAPMPPSVGAEWEQATGGFFVEGYGMTETSPVVAGTPMGPTRRLGALGLPFPSTDVRVVDPEALEAALAQGTPVDVGEEVPDGEPGELLVRGPQVFAGYWDDPEATAAVLLPGGWLRTGDMVRREESFLWMADRKRELILTGGFNVYPTQVEAAISSMPGVAQVAVVGIEKGTTGEEVVAAVVLERGEDGDLTEAARAVTLQAVREHAAAQLPRYALPRRLEVLDEMPRSMIGKLMRRLVREEIASRG